MYSSNSIFCQWKALFFLPSSFILSPFPLMSVNHFYRFPCGSSAITRLYHISYPPSLLLNSPFDLQYQIFYMPIFYLQMIIISAALFLYMQVKVMNLHGIFQFFAQSASQITWSNNPVQWIFLTLPYSELSCFLGTSHEYVGSNFKAMSA